MANAYPWTTEKSFKPQMKFRKMGRDISFLPMLLTAVVFSPLSFLGFAWALIGYRVSNNSWKFRGRVLMVFAIVLGLIFYGALRLNPVDGIVGLMSSFGDNPQKDFSVFNYLLNGLPISLFFAGVTGYFANGYFELLARRYLEDSKLSIVEKIRTKRNTKKFVEDDLRDEALEIGVVQDDVLPWRQNRRGMIVGTSSFDKTKHGYVIGANGTGKTIAAMNVCHEYSAGGWGIVFPDFKGDKKTENMLAAIAQMRGVPFYSFWSNSTDTGFNYDPLIGVTDISPASIIITAFDFPVDGPAAYYTDQCEKYLALQFTALQEYLEKGENESTFDWLLKTCDPKVLVNLLTPVAGSKDEDKRAAVKRLIAEINTVDRKNLSRLEANLSKVINTVGARMRPSKHMINFRTAADERAIVYFGLPSSGDKTVMRALGALIIRDLVSFTSERQGIESADVGNPVLVLPDEASQLQEKADAMLEILQQGRSARVMLMPAMQTFSSFSDKFIRELLGNSPTSIVFRVSDEVTALRLSENFREMFVRQERRDSTTTTDSLGAERQEFSSGSAGTIQKGPRISVEDIGDLENRTALVHFPESSRQATLKKPGKQRVSNPEQYTDIPTTLMVSRQYLLEAEDNYDLPREMLKKTLGMDAPVRSVVEEEDSLSWEMPEDFDDDIDDLDSGVGAVEEVVEVDASEFEDDFEDESSGVSSENLVSGSVEDVSNDVQEYQEELPESDVASKGSVTQSKTDGAEDDDEGHW